MRKAVNQQSYRNTFRLHEPERRERESHCLRRQPFFDRADRASDSQRNKHEATAQPNLVDPAATAGALLIELGRRHRVEFVDPGAVNIAGGFPRRELARERA